MRRVKPDYWYRPSTGGEEPFCKYAADGRAEDLSNLILLTDPVKAMAYWEKNGFDYMLNWAWDGFPGPCFINPHGDTWILSPDPGKEIDGDPVNDA